VAHTDGWLRTLGAVETGLPTQDARDDFVRQRRRETISRMARMLRGRSGSVDVMLPFDEVVSAVGRRGEQDLGERMVQLDAIVGSVDRESGFDRMFRPTSSEPQRRFEAINVAVRKGEAMPPIQLYKVGEAYFVEDGHHRVAVARALGWRDISARVTEVLTVVGTGEDLRLEQLPVKSHERIFRDRVPLPAEMLAEIRLSTPRDYGALAEGVEAWGFRLMQQCREWMSRKQIAEVWFREEYTPAIAMLRDAGLLDESCPTESYMRLATERYLLLLGHTWDDRVLDRLRAHRPAAVRRLTTDR
jgi:hypothetical protein